MINCKSKDNITETICNCLIYIIFPSLSQNLVSNLCENISNARTGLTWFLWCASQVCLITYDQLSLGDRASSAS